MLDYCDPPAGIFEWREKTESWHDSQSHEELRAKRVLNLALSAVEGGAKSIEIEARFDELAAMWAHETAHLSSPAQVMMHPSYQAILGLASDNKTEIVRLMINDLRQNRRPWFWALSYLTNANPVKPSEAGKMDKMIKSWIEWGKQHGLT